MNCLNCKEIIVPQAKHIKAGAFKCFKCNFINKLTNVSLYGENILKGMQNYGSLIYLGQPKKRFELNILNNLIGRSSDCSVIIDRIEHNGKCFISNRHCLINIGFDTATGKLRYKVSDNQSTNGTFVKNSQGDIYRLKETEVFDITENETINLGGADEFKIEPFIIPQVTLETYKVNKSNNLDIEMTA